MRAPGRLVGPVREVEPGERSRWYVRCTGHRRAIDATIATADRERCADRSPRAATARAAT